MPLHIGFGNHPTHIGRWSLVSELEQSFFRVPFLVYVDDVDLDGIGRNDERPTASGNSRSLNCIERCFEKVVTRARPKPEGSRNDDH